jgi:hypothetical protein
VDPSRIQTVWVGHREGSDPVCDLDLPAGSPAEDQVKEIRTLLVRNGVLFDPWVQ